MKKVLFRRTFYPGAINLPPDKLLFLQLDSRDFGVIVHRIVHALKITDFDNSIQSETISPEKSRYFLRRSDFSTSETNLVTSMLDIYGNRVTTLLFEYQNGPRAIIPVFYTDLILHFFEDGLLSPKEVEAFTTGALTHFIKVYRQATNDVLVRLPGQNFYERTFFQDATHNFESENPNPLLRDYTPPNSLSFGFKTFQHIGEKESYPQAPSEQETNFGKLTGLINSNDVFFEERQVLTDSFSKLVLNNDFRQAFLEAFIIIETTISKWVSDRKIASGISKNKLDEYETEIGISYKINVEIPILGSPISEKEKELLGQLNWARKLRNRIVHDSYFPSQEEALKTINLVSPLFDFINKRNA